MRATALLHTALNPVPDPAPTRNEFVRSTEMYTMHEALAREHMRQLETEARRHRLDTTAGYRRYLRPAQRRARQAHRMLRGDARPAQHSASAK